MIRDSVRIRWENARLVAQLEVEKQAAQTASRTKSLFLAGVSHDLKHPLHALGLYVGYLKTLTAREAEQGGMARALPPMELTLGGMAGLLARLLELSRLEAGELAPAWRTLALRETFDHCAVKFAQAARDKGLRLRFAASRARIRSDAGMLQSILDNLVANAVRYTQRGGIVVGVRKRAATLAIEVWDSGPGIPAERIELLFEAYRRFDDTAGGSEGHGLGLALVKKQCDLLGWGVAVRSAPGRGTVFCVTLPRASDVHG